jgi:serine/threonine-protein kinase
MQLKLPSPPSQIGRYKIVRLIGRGAMGQVLLARDTVLEREVALKHLRNDLNLPADQFAALGLRMQQEAKAAARVSHPHLVALHDMGQDPSVGLYLVFEYKAGAPRATAGGRR